ncbi:hypothetical protein H4R18_005256 [Coemansia javaensis]|uniref:G-protein coupled receptors family 3 profile domain-containing protein n=1 Tax=Coemansia javaensis TaxID=2761396 RepID=A0A9W8H8B7_9FUNG|nr:hypothetical protein H4R18_005256 [Coemansia javaensis]
MPGEPSPSHNEQWRKQLADILHMHLDMRGWADVVAIAVIAIVYGFDLVAAGYAVHNIKYPPIRCKSPLLMMGVLFCAVLWFVGDIQTNGHVPLHYTPLVNCKAFGVWVRIVFGVMAMSALVAARAYGLYRVFRLGRPFRGWGLFVPLAGFTLCTIAYGAVVQAVSPKLTIVFWAPLDICLYSAGFKASIFAVLWLVWTCVAVLSWKIRDIKSSFNEARESAIGCMAVFVVLILTTAIHYGQPHFAMYVVLRVVTTVFDHAAVNVFWWSVMGVPLFNCAFRRDRYLAEWMAKLRDDGLQVKYDVSPDETTAKMSASLCRINNNNTSLSAEPIRAGLYDDFVDRLGKPPPAGEHPLYVFEEHRAYPESIASDPDPYRGHFDAPIAPLHVQAAAPATADSAPSPGGRRRDKDTNKHTYW